MRTVWAVAAIFALTASWAGAPPASATAPRGISAEVLWQRTSGGEDFVFRRITVDPGGSTGWHWHRGRLYGVIVAGTLTHHRSDCSVDGVYPPGARIVEPGSPDNVHIGLNNGDEPLIMEIVYVNPAGAALAEDAPNPGCPFE